MLSLYRKKFLRYQGFRLRFSLKSPQSLFAGSVIQVSYLLDRFSGKVQTLSGVCLYYRSSSSLLGFFVVFHGVPVFFQMNLSSPLICGVGIVRTGTFFRSRLYGISTILSRTFVQK